MDEDRLTQLLHDAVQAPPPATFDADDVLNTSRRLTARRHAITRGTWAAAVVLLAAGLLTGLGVVGLGWFGHTGLSGSSAAASGGTNGPAGTAMFPPHVTHKAGPQIEQHDVPMSPPMQGGGGSGKVGPSADNTPGGCGSTDGELAVALAGELPSVGDPRPTAVPAGDCPTDARSTGAVSVHDNSAPGTVVAIIRRGAHAAVHTVPDAAQATVSTASGNTLTVLSQPEHPGGVIPFAGKVTTIANGLASKF